jgi:hypothetical protein
MNGEDIEIFSPIEVIRNDGNNMNLKQQVKNIFTFMLKMIFLKII